MADLDDPTGIAEAGATRRAVLLGAGAASAAGLLAACGGGTDTTTRSPGTPEGAPTTAEPASPTGAPTQTGSGIPKSEIPVGGGMIFETRRIVVTQPTAGTFKAFSSTCTHQGCTVDSISNGKIGCPCHGSQYNIADGSVAVGPATRPLAAKTVTNHGDTISVS
jgi:Rieske Fe-S protein